MLSQPEESLSSLSDRYLEQRTLTKIQSMCQLKALFAKICDLNHRMAKGSDLVGDVAVRCDPVGAGDDSLDFTTGSQVAECVVRNDRVFDALACQFPCGQA